MENKNKYKKIFLLVVAILLATKLIFDFKGFWSLFSDIGKTFVGVLSYIFIGFVIAYVLDAFARFLSDKIFAFWKKKRLRFKRILCIIMTYIVFAGILAFIIFTLLPYMTATIRKLSSELPGLADKSLAFYQKFLSGGVLKIPKSMIMEIDKVIKNTINVMITFLGSANFTGFLSATTTVIINAVMGIIVSVYMLLEKENVIHVTEDLIDSLCPKRTAHRIYWAGRKTNDIFTQYFSGKIIQCIIVTILAFILFAVTRLPYPLLFAVIIGIFNMVPYIGPWAGAIPVCLITLVTDSFLKGVVAVIVIIVIQCIDNFIVGPKIIGKKIGVSPLAVLCGLCIGGKLFGLPGMILGDVMAALVKVFFYDTYIEIKKRKRREQLRAATDNADDPNEDIFEK